MAMHLLGFMIRYSGGDVLLVGVKSLNSHISIIQAEAWVLNEGIKGAIFLNITHLII